jgi:hypothetical protein
MALESCAGHNHGSGGFVPLEQPFGSRSFPRVDAMLADDEVDEDDKKLARETLAVIRLRDEAREKEFKLMTKFQLLTEHYKVTEKDAAIDNEKSEQSMEAER